MLIAIFTLFIGILGLSFLWSFKKDKFLENESDRCLNNFCEVDENWNSNGKLYTRGLAVIEENGKTIYKTSKVMRYWITRLT